MANGVRVVGLGGSLSANSSSLTALKIALDAAKHVGADTQIFDIGSLDLPMFTPDEKNPPADVLALCEAVYQADGMLWSSPLYHGTISGAFKNALDWLELLGNRQPSYLTDKVIGLISAAGGSQGLQAINTMEYVVRALRGWAVPLVIPISQAWKAFDANGHAHDTNIEEQLGALGREVVRAAAQFKAHPLSTPDVERAENEQQPLQGQ